MPTVADPPLWCFRSAAAPLPQHHSNKMDVENLRAGRILEDKLAALRNELERLRLRGVDVAPLRKAINEYRKAQSIVDALGRNEKYSIALRMELEKLGSSQAE